MKGRMALIVATVLLAIAVTISISVSASKKRTVPKPLQGATIVFVHRTVFGDKLEVTSVAVRYISEDGRWREIRSYPSLSQPTATQEITISDSRGVFQLGDHKATVLGHSWKSAGASRPAYNSPTFLRQSPSFRREGTVLDYQTYVWQVTEPDRQGYYEEVEFAAELGSLPIRSTIRDSSGAVVDEEVAMLVTPGNPPEKAVGGPAPEAKLDFSALDRKVAEQEKRGMDATALKELKQRLSTR